MSDVNVEQKDILEVFKTAVRNGQTRLALEALVDVIDAIVEIIVPNEEQPENNSVLQQDSVVEEKPKEEKTPSKKKVKEEASATTVE